jgi:hypothetical protein
MLLSVSIFLNLLLVVRVQQLHRGIQQTKGGVELSKEELEQLKVRLEKLKRIT